MHVPLHYINEESAVGVKTGGGIISHLMSSVDIVCLAKDLPEYIEVDVANLDVGESLHLSDIKLPSGVEIPVLAQGEDHDLPVVSIHAKKKGADDDVEAVAPSEGEAPTDTDSGSSES